MNLTELRKSGPVIDAGECKIRVFCGRRGRRQNVTQNLKIVKKYRKAISVTDQRVVELDRKRQR